MRAEEAARKWGGRLTRVDRAMPVSVPHGSPGGDACAVSVVAEPAAVAARIEARERPSLVVCFPGGGYTKEYYDPQSPLGEDYSMAADLARRGNVVVVCDHLGTGASTHPPRPEQLGVADLVEADAQVVVAVVAIAAAGGLVPGVLPPLDDPALLGVAHSMGGGLLVVQQARHPRFGALALMGWSAVHMPSSSELAQFTGTPAGSPGRLVESSVFPGDLRVERGPLQHAAYHWRDVPDWVIAIDDAAATEVPPAIASAMNVPGAVRAEAALIEVPVFVLMGERDLCMRGSDEASAYSSAPRVNVFELAASGHCHNLAGTRKLAWRHVGDWFEDVLSACTTRAKAPTCNNS